MHLNTKVLVVSLLDCRDSLLDCHIKIDSYSLRI